MGGFQKVGMVCLLLDKFLGQADARTQECASFLAAGFKCLYNRSACSETECTGVFGNAPIGSYYDEDWGGIPSKAGINDERCKGAADFGNACYNDHHYHYGYFVVAASILAKLSPEYLNEAPFVEYVNILIRDTTNPSKEDKYFPQFRVFDWFDLHSWSRGLPPSDVGKDEESTSEELNLLYGMRLWAGLTNNTNLEGLAITMLSLDAMTIREFFLLMDGNPHHPPDFVKNHVTGIVFQGKVDYATWFSGRHECIHGIQMMPLSPALQLTRKRDYCQQEWDANLKSLPLDPKDRWTSILITGTLAIIDPSKAYRTLSNYEPHCHSDTGKIDDGLTRAWALYWAAAQPTVVTQ